MSGFVEGIDRSQSSLFPAQLDDYVAEDNLVRSVDAFVDGLDLGKLGFGRVVPLEKGRPCYHPATLLKIYIYGYLNRIPSSRRLERECQRNIELVWLTGQLAPAIVQRAPRRAAVVPPGRGPGASRVRGCEPRPRAAVPAPSSGPPLEDAPRRAGMAGDIIRDCVWNMFLRQIF